MATQERGTVRPLTSFRFFAVMAVVIYHFFGIESGVPKSSRLHLPSVYRHFREFRSFHTFGIHLDAQLCFHFRKGCEP
jgi:hypothetical protein